MCFYHAKHSLLNEASPSCAKTNKNIEQCFLLCDLKKYSLYNDIFYHLFDFKI